VALRFRFLKMWNRLLFLHWSSAAAVRTVNSVVLFTFKNGRAIFRHEIAFRNRPQPRQMSCPTQNDTLSAPKSCISHAYELALLLHQNSANNSFTSHTYRHSSRKSFRFHTYRKTGGGGALFPGPSVFSAHSFHSSGKSETSSPFYSGTSTLFANTQIQGTYTPPSRKTAVFIRQSTTPMEPTERLSPITHSRITRHGSPEHESTPFRHFARRSLCPKKPYLQAHHLMAKRTRTVVLSRVYTCSSLGLGRPNSCNPLRQNF
jgi:hypothetical protein